MLERLKANCEMVMEKVRKDDWDYLTILDGGERSGKTTLACHMLRFKEPSVERDIQCGIFDTMIRKCVWRFEDAETRFRDANLGGSALMYNEARILGRRAMKELNLRMIDVMTTIGNLNISQDWTFPSFHMLDPYLRQRARLRGYVYTVKGVRGYVTWYVRRQYPFPRGNGETVWWKRAYSDRFPSMATISPQHGEAWYVFNEMDKQHKRNILEGKGESADPKLGIMLRLRERGLFIRDIAEVMDMSRARVGELLKGTHAGKVRIRAPPANKKPVNEGLVVAENTSTIQ